MNTHETILKVDTEQVHRDLDCETLATCGGHEAIWAERMLDQVEEAQTRVQELIDDISLLQTAENALDLIAENLSKVRRLTLARQQGGLSRFDEAEISDSINNLMMVTILVAEDTEYNGHRLFSNDVIELNGTGDERLFLATSQLPPIQGIETNDCEAVMDSLANAARVINRQYGRICKTLSSLMDAYKQIHGNLKTLTNQQAQCRT